MRTEAGAVARSTGVGGRADFCSMQNLHSRHPWRSTRRRAYMDVFTQHLTSIAHCLWLTTLDNLGAGFTASCRTSDRTLRHQRTFICRGDGQAFMNVTLTVCEPKRVRLLDRQASAAGTAAVELFQAPRCLLRHYRNLKCERYNS